MRNRIFAVLAIAVLAGGGLAYGTYNMMQSQPVKTVSAPTQPVVVAAADLSLGAEIKPEHLKVLPFPAGQAPEGSFAQPQEIVGRGLIVSVVKHEPILPAKLASKEAGAGLPPVIPEGMRAVSVRVNEVIGVAGYVLPGTHVDVIATASPTQQTVDTTSKVVLANVLVLTAGTRIEQDQKDGKPVQVTVVTMAVTPEQAELLALASTEGKIQLALRNPLDQTAPATPGMRPAVMLGLAKGGAAAQQRHGGGGSAKPKPGQAVTVEASNSQNAPTVEIIRGDKRATETVK
jgi:pilus assembly protein CpaB